MTVNLTTNQEEITKAWRDVVDSKNSQKWALFGYQGNTNTIKLFSTGSNGLKELVREFNNSLIQYAFCRVLNNDLGINKLILINWQGDSSPLSRKGLCASHVGDVANYFKGCSQTITIRNDDEATEEYLIEQIVKTSHSRVRSVSGLGINSTTNSSIPSESNEKTTKQDDALEKAYKKVDITPSIALDRKSFWQRQEEEEKERLLEEKKRAAEKQAQFERERKLREESEAKKLAETIRERDRIIDATRKAERHDSLSSGSQPSSNISSNAMSSSENNDDDDRVGRRSELIRLERNQETQSLISKGLIKNKRAIFEQAASMQQSQQAPPLQSNLTRRASGAMITQRMNSLKSFDRSSSGSSSLSTTNPNSVLNDETKVEKLTNGFVEQVKINSGNQKEEKLPQISNNVVKSKIETIKVTNNEIEQPKSTFVDESLKSYDDGDKKTVNPKSQAQPHPENGDAINNNNNNVEKRNLKGSNDDKDNFIQKESPMKNPKVETETTNGSKSISTTNGQNDIRAKALYDYQASDKTEISFDPDDVIGYIEKVDPGWWYGTVVTGEFKGQQGLFPSNYVQEL